MAIRERMSGNEAVAHAIKQINPDVMAAFPITPSTEIPQMVSTFIANGDIDTEFIPVESEHSSMSATMVPAPLAQEQSQLLLPVALLHVGSTLCRSFRSSSNRYGGCKPCINRTDQHQL